MECISNWCTHRRKIVFIGAPRSFARSLFVRVCSDFASELCDYGGAELEGGGTRRAEKVVWFDPLVSGCAGGACERARIGVMQKSRGRSFGRCVVVLCVCPRRRRRVHAVMRQSRGRLEETMGPCGCPAYWSVSGTVGVP